MVKTYEETFVSPFLKDTEGEALKTLEQIRAAHPEFVEKDGGRQYGWKELKGYAEQVLDEKGNIKWRAVRVHELHRFDAEDVLRA